MGNLNDRDTPLSLLPHELKASSAFVGDDRHGGEPGCAVRAALDDGRLGRERFASHRKLEQEAAHAARSGDRLLREAERRKWKAIGMAGRTHMQQRYGSER